MKNGFFRYNLFLFVGTILFTGAVLAANCYIDLLHLNTSPFRAGKTFLRAHKIDLFEKGWAQEPYEVVFLGSSISYGTDTMTDGSRGFNFGVYNGNPLDFNTIVRFMEGNDMLPEMVLVALDFHLYDESGEVMPGFLYHEKTRDIYRSVLERFRNNTKKQGALLSMAKKYLNTGILLDGVRNELFKKKEAELFDDHGVDQRVYPVLDEASAILQIQNHLAPAPTDYRLDEGLLEALKDLVVRLKSSGIAVGLFFNPMNRFTFDHVREHKFPQYTRWKEEMVLLAQETGAYLFDFTQEGSETPALFQDSLHFHKDLQNLIYGSVLETMRR